MEINLVNHVQETTMRTWQILSDGSIPGMAPLSDSNDLMVGGQNEANGLYRRTTGVEVDSEGKQRFTYGLTNSVSGLGGNDFMSGEQYDDYLDGGDDNDLIWGGAGSGEFATDSGATGAFWISSRSRFDPMKKAQNDKRWICAA